MTFLRAAVAAVLLVVLPAALASAQARLTFPDAPLGTLVVSGRVARVESRWEAASRTIHSYVTLEVARVMLGGVVPATLVLDQLGGETGGIGLWLPDQAQFAIGEDVLVVLTADTADGALHTVGLGRGKFTLDTSAVRGGTASAGPGTITPGATISIAEAERLLAQGPRRALTTYAALAPNETATSGPDAPGFTYLPTGGDPARWHEVDDHAAVFVDHPLALPGTWTGTTTNTTAAINLWRNSGMELDLRDGGNTLAAGQCSAAFTGNGRIAVSYNDPCGISDWVIGGGYYTTGDLRTVNGQSFQKFIQGFVVLNDTGPQTSAAGCFQDAVAHGLGHALGLGHTGAGGSMMEANPRAGCTSGPGALGSDDLAGITTIYRGIASGPFPPDPPTNFTATASLSTVTLAWTPAATGGTAQRYFVDAGTAPGIYNLGALPFPASPTSTNVTAVPPGTYYVRVRAQNAIGTSLPSAERQVVVGACVAPGPPGTLTGSSNDTTVGLQWSAPASGVAQGYRLAAGSGPGLSNVVIQELPGATTSYGAVAPYGTYFVRVLATNVCGVSAPSNEITLAVQPCTAAPQVPAALSFTKSGTTVALSWTAPAGPAPTSYTLAVGSAPGLANVAVIPTGSAMTTFGAVAPIGTYYVRVLAQNACGASAASNEVVVQVP